MQQKLSPAQIQVVRLLELPSCELSARVNEELQDNPALEEGEDGRLQIEDCRLNDNDNDNDNLNDNYSDRESERESYEEGYDDDLNVDAYTRDDDLPDYRYYAQGGGDDDDDDNTHELPLSAGMSFGEYLKSQVYLTHMTKPQRHIAKFVVGNIDEDGYLRRSVEELCDDLYFREGITVTDAEMQDIITQIQTFDPAGVGARDLKECLLIQLRQRPDNTLPLKVITTCFDDFSHRRFDHIQEKLSISSDELKDVISEITKLNPKPGSAWQGTVYDRHQTSIIPDFYVDNQDGQLTLTLNTGDIPSLHVSRDYKEMLLGYSEAKNPTKEQKEAVRFVKAKLDAAQSFIDAIHQRNETLYRTMSAILKAQHDWFMEGDETYLRPLVLQDIANQTGYDVSTISRVSNSKYVQTEFGVFPLKYFFSEKMVNAEGEEISTREIKAILSECVDKEDKSAPLTDDALVNVLQEKGYPIARRTVAKYRDQLGIPVARLRRQL